MRCGTDFTVLKCPIRFRHSAITMVDIEQNQKRLQQMIRGSMRVIRNSEALLQKTKKLVDQVRAVSFMRIRRPDHRMDQSE